MTIPIQYPYINGVRHGFSSIEFRIAGQIVIGFKALDYSRTRSRTEVRGNHPDPLGKTRGENAYKGEVEMYLAEFNLIQSILDAGATAYGDTSFTVVATYGENGFDTIQDILIGCTLDTTDGGGKQGTEPLTRKFELNPLKILYNKLDDLTVPLVGVPT